MNNPQVNTRQCIRPAAREVASVLMLALPLAAVLSLSGCGTVLATADAAGTIVMTGVKVGAEVVGTTVDVAASGVRAVAGSSDKK